MIKTVKLFAVLAALVALSVPALAQSQADKTKTAEPVQQAQAAEKKSMIPGEFSAGVLLTNDYVFRGISQTDDVPAIQGNIDWSHDSGIHLGMWASNVKFTDASIEIDYTGGCLPSAPMGQFEVIA